MSVKSKWAAFLRVPSIKRLMTKAFSGIMRSVSMYSRGVQSIVSKSGQALGMHPQRLSELPQAAAKHLIRVRRARDAIYLIGGDDPLVR